MKKTIKVDYIESGTFQGGEEEASQAGIEYGETVIVMKQATYKAMSQRIKELEKRCEKLLRVVTPAALPSDEEIRETMPNEQSKP